MPRFEHAFVESVAKLETGYVTHRPPTQVRSRTPPIPEPSTVDRRLIIPSIMAATTMRRNALFPLDIRFAQA
jgi:hypothetical protein